MRRSRKRGARLGQHLLTNKKIADAVADAAHVSKNDLVFEIGPGKGMLTRALLEKGANVIAVEKDPAMIFVLREEFKKEIKEKRLELIDGDVRDFLSDTIFKKEKYKVVANIPYYITGELLRTCLSLKHQPQVISFLVQKEVAERIARSKKESILSLSVKVYGIPKYVKTVSRGNFNPPPSVDSAILAIENISRKNFKGITEEQFFKVVKAGFAAKRKTLGGNFKKVFGEWALHALSESDISEKARAEDVPLQKWITLTEKLQT